MNRRFKGALAVGAALALSLSLFAVGSAAKSKIQRLGTSTQVETSTKGNKRTLTVTGVLQSSSPRCERQRSVLLFEAGPTGELAGGAIGHGVSQGGSQRGQFTISGNRGQEDHPDPSLHPRVGRPQGQGQGQGSHLQARRLGQLPGRHQLAALSAQR